MTDVNQQASVYCVLRVDPLTGFAEPDGVPTALVRYLNGVVVDVLLDGSDNFSLTQSSLQVAPYLIYFSFITLFQMSLSLYLQLPVNTLLLPQLFATW